MDKMTKQGDDADCGGWTTLYAWGTECWGEVSYPECVVLEAMGEGWYLFAPVFDDLALVAEGDELASYRHRGDAGKVCVVAHVLARVGRSPLEMRRESNFGPGVAPGRVVLGGERHEGPSSPEALEHRKKLDADLACFLGQAGWVRWPTEEELRRKEELAIWKAGLRAKRLAREAEEAAAAQEGDG